MSVAQGHPARVAWLAAASLWVLTLTTGARLAHAAADTALLPTQDSCVSCNLPIAQAQAPVQGLPAAPTPAAMFRLADVRLNGAQALSDEELQRITRPYIGREVTLGDLESLAQAITAQYRARGYFLAQAVVPVQVVKDGIVEISVIEGRIGKIEVLVAPDAPISEARVRAFLAPLEVGRAVSAPAYERAMLLLSDQPGLRVSSALQEGMQTGTTDLTVEVAAAQRWAFSTEADNQGSKESGRYRVGGTVRWRSPFGIGDNLDARLMVSNGNALQFGRLSYEAPIGTDGWRAGAGLSRINYELGGDFAVLGAQGTANIIDLSLSYPLIRQRGHNLFVRLSADDKHLTDELRAFDAAARKNVRDVGVGWTWERRDEWGGGGYWSSVGIAYRGSLDIRDVDVLARDQSSFGHRTDGGYSKLTFQIGRLQAVLPRHSVYLSVGGQRASKNLDASEKLALGGARAVRAYPSGEALVDQGLIGTAEWRWSFNEEITPFLFYDAARGRLTRSPLPQETDNTRSLRGYGVGVSWARAGSFLINATLAMRDATPRPRTDGGSGNVQLFVQLQKAF